MNIDVFDKGTLLCVIELDPKMASDGPCAEVIQVVIEDKELDVLYLKDMDYGIVIPNRIATQINLICNRYQQEVKVNKDKPFTGLFDSDKKPIYGGDTIQYLRIDGGWGTTMVYWDSGKWRYGPGFTQFHLTATEPLLRYLVDKDV